MCKIQFNLLVKSDFFSSSFTKDILCFISSIEPFQNFFSSFSFFGSKNSSTFGISILFSSVLTSSFSSVFTSSLGSSFFSSFLSAFFSFFFPPFSDFFSSFYSIVFIGSCLGGSGSLGGSGGKGNSSFIPRISFMISLFNLFKFRITLVLNSILYSLFSNLK